MIPKVHLTPTRAITRMQDNTRAFPLNEPNMPQGDGTPASLTRIIQWLGVEQNARYRPTQTQTFCNIYAYDYAYLAGAYLPRVFWTRQAIEKGAFTPHYGTTVAELNANALYDWFAVFGTQFGWKQVTRFTDAQELANAGKCVIMVAANLNRSRSGHIVAIVPETEQHKATGSAGISNQRTVAIPLMSQAGRVNHDYFSTKWWNGHEPARMYVFE